MSNPAPSPYSFSFPMTPSTYSRLKTGLIALGYANHACTEIILTKPTKVRLGVDYNMALGKITLSVIEKPYIVTDGTVEMMVKQWLGGQGVTGI